MKALPEGNVFSKHYTEKLTKNRNNNNQSYNFDFNPTFEQINQNASQGAKVSLIKKPSTRKKKFISKPNKRRHKTSNVARNVGRIKNVKRLRTDILLTRELKDEISKEIEKNENNSSTDLVQFLNPKFEKPSSASDFCDLFEFQPCLIPSDNYRDSVSVACHTFYQYYLNTIEKILDFAQEQNLFRMREFLRFSNEVKVAVAESFQSLILFFLKNPFCCPHGNRFSSIRQLFEHKSCSNCKPPNEKPIHLCQCGKSFETHEDWIGHVFSRRGDSCIVTLFSLFMMHEKNIEVNTSHNCKIFFCSGCQRKTTNFLDLYFHMIYCPAFELKLIKSCTFCNRKTKQIYELTNCHKQRSAKSVFSQLKQPSPVNYVKLLGKFYKIIPPTMLAKLKSGN